jgi:hypothetical protein
MWGQVRELLVRQLGEGGGKEIGPPGRFGGEPIGGVLEASGDAIQDEPKRYLDRGVEEPEEDDADMDWAVHDAEGVKERIAVEKE